MKTIIEVDGLKIKVIKEEIGTYIMKPFSKENPKQMPVLTRKRIVYSLKGKDKYEKFRKKETYEIDGKYFYRTIAEPPHWEFKFIEF